MAAGSVNEYLPCLLATSCDNYCLKNIVADILNVVDLPSSEAIIENITGYKWHINNKYYSTDIRICVSYEKTIGNIQFAESVEAFLIHVDTNNAAHFEHLNGWLPFLNELNPGIKLIVCEKSTNSQNIPRSILIEWCLDNEFELIELDPQLDDEDNENYSDCNGIPRIRQSLNAHLWPNLILHEEKTSKNPTITEVQETLEESGKPSTEDTVWSDFKSYSEPDENKSQTETNTKNDENNTLDEVESFEQLFQNLSVMTEKAKNLPQDERKDFAEKVALSFWKAMGGDSDEEESD